MTLAPANLGQGWRTAARKFGVKLPATAWQTGADQLTVTLNLPPGWRLFALFGADWVSGDWLASWSLLDIFVVLVFTLAVFRVCGASPPPRSASRR